MYFGMHKQKNQLKVTQRMKSKMNSKMTAGSNGIAGRKCIGITTETDKC